MRHSKCQLLSLADLAVELGFPVPWIASEAIAGRIPFVRVGDEVWFSPWRVQTALVARLHVEWLKLESDGWEVGQ
ncbi:hypothetical protein Pla163_11160 [Planctomycetes bacterium Pla163]|uniref:DNA-binding protein n=1 Tax=Rohdeia mirabilis TaxID=2528008 RepID=A0A518CXR5_9BACT|nr:hypothetical protein Pla163_11160 [Planctomycetes bacterium Pla163]